MRWKVYLGLLISSIFIYFAFRNVNPALLIAAINSKNVAFLLPIVAGLTILLYLIRALRWFYLLEPIKKISLSSLFSATVIGFAANFVLPVRLGELVRANHIGSAEGMSKSSTLATIVVERLFDCFTILLMLLFVLFSMPFYEQGHTTQTTLKTAGLFLMALIVTTTIVIIALKERATAFLSLTEKFPYLPATIRQKIADILKKFTDGLVFTKGPKQLIAVLFYSLVLWLLYVLQIYIIAFSLEVSLPFLAPFLILVLICFSVSIPSAPGYIGTFHVACQYGLIFFGCSKEKALSMAIILHASGFIPSIILGMFIFFSQHLYFRGLINGKLIDSKNNPQG